MEADTARKFCANPVSFKKNSHDDTVHATGTMGTNSHVEVFLYDEFIKHIFKRDQIMIRYILLQDCMIF